jgi:hypothetical protein
MPRECARRALLDVCLLPLLLCTAVTATADEGDRAPSEKYAAERIELASLLPWRVGGQAGSWHIDGLSLQPGSWRIALSGPDGAAQVLATPVLIPPAHDEQIPTFRFTAADGSDASEAAAESLAGALAADGDEGEGPRLLVDLEIVPTWRLPFAIRLARDGTLWFLLFVTVLAFTVRASLRAPPLAAPVRHVLLYLLAIAVAGGALRLLLSPANIHGPYPFRIHILGQMLVDGPVLPWLARFGPDASRFEVLIASNFVLAVLTPVAFFAYTLLLTGRQRVALLCAALVAALPQHVRFSASEVEFIPLLAGAPVLLGLTHILLRPLRWPIRVVTVLALTSVGVIVLATRPLAPFLAGIGLLTVLGLSPPGTPWGRRLSTAVVLIATGACAAYIGYVNQLYTSSAGGEALGNLLAAATGLVRPGHNVYLDPHVTPVVFLPLAALGLFGALRSGESRLGALLVAWFVGYFVVGGIVLEPGLEMRSRYQLSALPPLLILAALGADWLYTRRPWLCRGVLLVGAGLWPLQVQYVVGEDYDIQREEPFVAEFLEQLDERCIIVEPSWGSTDARIELNADRFGARGLVRTVGVLELREALIDTAPLSLGRQLAWAMAASTEQCVLNYHGLTCAGLRDEAPFCLVPQIHEFVQTERLVTSSFPSNPYDRHATPSIEPGEPIELRWTRWRGPRE